MKNQITIGGKIGYLNLKTGKYIWAEIINMNTYKLKMKQKQNIYEEKISDIIKYLKTPSIDFKDGRPLLKYKGTTKLY